MISTCISVYVFVGLISISWALECYVCVNQEDNKGKCVHTIQTCPVEEDVCLSEISWGTSPYWQQGNIKQYYISKRCASKDKCAKYRGSNMATCTHIWYQDWKCSECCKGDRCNYYVISGAISSKVNLLLTVVTTIMLIFSYIR